MPEASWHSANPSKILVEDGHVAGVRVDPRVPSPSRSAPIVISNADLKHTLQNLLRGNLHRSMSRAGRGFEMGGAIMISHRRPGGSEELGMQARNYWCFDTNDPAEIYRSVAEGSLTPRAVYITSASLKDPDTHGHTPEGVMGVEVMALMPGSAQAWGVEPADIRTGLAAVRNGTSRTSNAWRMPASASGRRPPSGRPHRLRKPRHR